MKNYEAWNIEPLAAEKAVGKDLLKNLAGWAILAANSHNVQPWRFIGDSGKNAIEICVPAHAILPASDKKGRQAHISVGCALENLVLAASYYGLDSKIDYLGPAVYPDPILRATFSGKINIRKEMEDFLAGIKKRKMNRGKYDSSRPLPVSLIAEAVEFAGSNGIKLDIITDAPTRIAISEIQYHADRAVVMFNDFRKELGGFLLPNDTDSKTGMPGNTFGLSKEMASHVHAELNKPGTFDPDLAAGFASSGRDGIRSAPALGIISVPEDSHEWWIKAGRVLERTAILAEINNMAIAVHAAMVEVGIFNAALKVRLGSFKKPASIFRIGHPLEDRPHSPRQSVEEVFEFRN